MNNKRIIFLAIAAVILFAGYYAVTMRKGIVSTKQINQNSIRSGNQVISQTSPNTSDNQPVKEIAVTGNEFAFNPSAITVKRGQPVQITFTNNGAYPHNFVLADLNIQTKTIQPGQSDTIKFIVDKPGQYTYICSVDSHADKGMTGVLTVE